MCICSFIHFLLMGLFLLRVTGSAGVCPRSYSQAGVHLDRSAVHHRTHSTHTSGGNCTRHQENMQTKWKPESFSMSTELTYVFITELCRLPERLMTPSLSDSLF